MIRIVYVTQSTFKKKENACFVENCALSDGTRVKDVFQFEFRSVHVQETLESDLEKMVRAEVLSAYSKIKVPCIVEHAGLVFEDYQGCSYPGGLTKPMWNALGDHFVSETNSADRRVIARAVVAYCDGVEIRTFTGETKGKLASAPRGSAAFYWDTVFIPEDLSGASAGKTYAEIVDDPSLGLVHKVINLSQSSRAMLNFLHFRRNQPLSQLWGRSWS
ncbi:non-canonical purine NTP pyrophosphatase [Nannocystis radixulma]|uniref:Non-canonical purine NTP pyrophosphatase n=1 Tax=Nannocystis radixulma TaxID=2995305 RepID=A0ABT5BNZ2_9BACT|nr:non-canonical purine NTP pyrophosphatase [Nannocystis radixulma]MDC0675822.1 non-canonical purine NTP pyrophosphatase [Nannocystis radixulma]